MDYIVLFARTSQIFTLILSIYTTGLAIKRFSFVSHLRFRADHIYHAVILIFLLSFGLVYLCAHSLTVPLQYHWWVISLDRVVQLALFIGILNCICGCTSGADNAQDSRRDT